MLHPLYQTVEEIDYQLGHGMSGPLRDEAYTNFVRGAYRARESFSPCLDLMYGKEDRQRMDMFTAEPNPGDCPTIIFFHGGSWRLSDKFFANFWAEAFCPAGFNFIAVTYGFLPQYTMDEIIAHARLAVEFIIKNASSMCLDRERFILGGNSAGSHLALMSLLHDWSGSAVDPRVFKGTFGFSPLLDFELLRLSTHSKAYVPSVEKAKAWTPWHHVKGDLPPAFFAFGDEETPEFARQSEAMALAWQQAGNEAEVHRVPGGNHYNTQWMARTTDDPLHARLMQWVQRVTT